MTDFDLNIIEGGWAHEEMLFLDDFWDPLIIPEVIGTRRCKECKNIVNKILDCYLRSAICKTCQYKRQRIRILNNIEKNRAYMKEYAQKNKEKIKFYKRNWEKENEIRLKAERKEYQIIHKEKLSERNKEYYQENKDHIIEKSRKYLEENREEINRKRREKRAENPYYYREQHRNNYYNNHEDRLKSAAKRREKNRNKIRMSDRFYNTNWNNENYEKAREIQNHCCAICNVEEKDASSTGVLVADHDHSTGAIRALLCSKCNSAEGFIKGNRDNALRLMQYIDFYDLYQNGETYVPFNPELLKTAKEEDFSTEVINRIKSKYKEELRKEILLELSEKGVDISGIIQPNNKTV